MIQVKDFFVIRQPTYPIDRLIQFYSQLNTQPLNDLLRQHYQDPLAQEAIFAASPTLYERFQRWLSGETLPEQEKLLVTLHKYFIRMCSRPTPYGLFAGCTMGTFGEQSQLRGGTADTLRTHTRVDMDCLLAICAWLTSQPAVRTQVKLFPNSSLYPVGSSLRYVEQQRDNEKRNYFISAVEADRYLTVVLKAARDGATINELTALLIDLQAAPDEADEFVEQLIDGQLLLFEIEPTVTGLNYLNRLTERIATLANTDAIVADLRQLQANLQQPNRLDAYAQTRQWFLDRAITPPAADIVQVDTYFDNPALQLSDRAMQLLQRDLEKLMVLNQTHVCPDMDEFKRRFYMRYEDEEIPLALALDQEFGIGYGSGSTLGVGYAPLIDDLSFVTAATASVTTWDWWQTFVMNKYAGALRMSRTADAAGEIVLTDDDLAYIGSKQAVSTSIPDSFYVFGTVLSRSVKGLDEGDFRFNLLACKGPSAVNLMSRFGEGDPALAQRIRACAAAEEVHHPDVIIAEIVHLPENRVGNILTRPTIHPYEIPYMGQSSVSPEFQIALSDLMVSVRNDQVVLRSKRLNQRVIPRLTNAHNFTQGLPIYRFLCDLQAQDAHLNVVWNWSVLQTQTYLPRVRYNRVILSRATWQLQPRDLTPDNPLRLVAQLTAAGLPDQFMLAQGDNELFIAMHVPESLALLSAEIRRLAGASSSGKPGTIRLVEFLAQPDQCPLASKRSHFTHELIIPFGHKSAHVLPGLSQSNTHLPQRKFSVGSEWFYLKVYTGEKTSDALLLKTIYPVVQQLLKTHMIQAFFFIRYKDTDPHLRLRFRGNPHLEFYHHVVRAIEKALHESVEAGVVHRVQVDTYQREFERYGMEHIGLCETLFHYDSLSTLDFLARTGDEFDENLRFAFAIRKIDRLLTGTGLPASARRTILETMKESFFQEFGGDLALRHQLNEKYRTYRTLMNQALAADFPIADRPDVWDSAQDDLLQKLAAAFNGSGLLKGIISSLIHMIVNRLFPSKQRAYELVLYHCLAKHYDSVQARERSGIVPE
ncbi:lantibiotic dehydratase [Spirosoma utsteinense]|uniref:Thiopeptide-type bacteriocin biosynthesis protein n=1 Tax=Spirosoma utsteinense TaxID=2585773 RepID=A0ABR6W3S7_9BACT|nr:lantibiotic dehydratase [Spirosoma utsteinense]MBC3788046.1 thiopeptide-type bacteriocin biosynthesis protein [Spirosoma utsteinense]MBC3791251.1 thiopeptide-type bacteriocin biosynthesis protein [Spirosoma utsteinense]